MKMAEFFVKAGALLDTQHSTTGNTPRRTFIVTFTYENGIASYNGKEWTLEIF